MVNAMYFEQKMEEFVSRDKIGLIYSVCRCLLVRGNCLLLAFFADFLYLRVHAAQMVRSGAQTQ